MVRTGGNTVGASERDSADGAPMSAQPSPTDRHTIGCHGVRVSVLGFGAAPMGNLYARVTEDEAQAALHAAFEGGIRYFDTAPFYGHGLSEERLGRAFAGRPRDTFVISTKVGRRIAKDELRQEAMHDGFAVRGTRAIFDYSREGVQRSFEASLRRLGVDRIDILLLHDIGRVTRRSSRRGAKAGAR
jgi:D-threo-aldose 1-dehydrogenase